MTKTKYCLILYACLFIYSSTIVAQTDIRYYKDEALTRETSQKKAKFILTKEYENGVVTEVVTQPNGTLIFRESYRGEEPVGIWRLPSGEELDFNFELRYESLGDKYIVPKVENLEEKEDTSKIAKTAIPTIDSFPVYQGGEAGMLNFLSANIRYPRKAIDSNLTGIVYISFIVERDGSVGDVYCTKGVHPLLDKDAQRVVRKMRFDKPAYQRGKAVRMSYTLPVKFYLK